jgi:formylglycine-generating enzyme required for sulfatase activity
VPDIPSEVRLRSPIRQVRLGPVILLAAVAAACARPQHWTEPLTGMEFVLVRGGSFTMGSPASEPGHQSAEMQHPVVLRRNFYLGVSEVTQAQWARVFDRNPSTFTSCGGGECPVEGVSWFDVQRFLVRLSASTGRRFRLPSEAEWEYACRAGSSEAYSSGPSLSAEQANFDGRYPLPGGQKGLYRARPTAVRSFTPNAFGLYDMHGNLWEWTQDDFCPYPAGPVTDPVARCGAPLKVIRGGSWAFDADSARCALRYTHRPQDSGYSLGFRLVRLD